MIGASVDLEGLARTPKGSLERLFAAGTRPATEDLVGWEFRGTAPLLRPLRLDRFVKGFVETATGPGGYNAVCSRRDWRRRSFRGRDLRHSRFDLRPATGHHEGTLVMDYASSPGNRRWWPGRLFRDFLVHPDPDNRDLLLGKAYLRLGRLVPVGFFVLERDRPVKETH